ncbi:MAG: ParB/RepB/Spo0J family partition protein [Defluviitaleaceae bacterium]|nr:ParB/RepB/Spo0J family partition protein [Defluviitaleaceae bacterium]
MSLAQSLEYLEVETPKTQVYDLPVGLINPNPHQPRTHFEPMALVDLATSIQQFGVMQPITVRTLEDGTYELIAGERRLRATKLANIPTIPALVVEITDAESAVLALVENLQRQNLNYIEEAEGFSNLLTHYNLTQEELAKKMGKTQSTIANKLRILKLPQKIKNTMLHKGLSERHARALLKIQKELSEEDALKTMLDIIDKIEAQGLNVQKTEELIEKTLKVPTEKKTQMNVKAYIKDMRIFTNTIKQAVGVMHDAGLNAAYDIEEHEDGCVITVLVSY